MNGLAGSQDNLLLGTLLKMWKELCMEAHYQKQLQALQSQHEETLSQHEESRNQKEKELLVATAGKLVGSQDNLFLGAVLEMWKDFCTDARCLREVEKVKSEMHA